MRNEIQRVTYDTVAMFDARRSERIHNDFGNFPAHVGSPESAPCIK
jgi:hypothetical protein